jgi:hypothetical protein
MADKPTQSYAQKRERERARSAEITLAGQDIAPCPPVKNPTARAEADCSFRRFCERYYPHLFTLAWSDDHLRVIAKIERVVRFHEMLAVAMPRGSGKTTLCQIAVIWAILSGRHQFVVLVAATEDDALNLLANIKKHLASNPRLLDDYPEAIYPIRKLEGETRRCVGQRYYGSPTQIGWSNTEIVMPTIPGSKCSGSIIRVSGITGKIRGALYVRSDGNQVRPSLVILDDPQTDESARSLLQTSDRFEIINGAIRGLAGPTQRTAIIIPCTVIRAGDLADKLLDRQTNPHWHGERTKMVYQFPGNAKLWADYAKIRQESLRADGDGREATEFYRAHRDEMDSGAVVSWPQRFDPDEISAIQHAMNLRFTNEQSFFAEYQNEPMASELAEEEQLTATQVAERTNGRMRGEIPTRASQLTAFIDVHDKLLYYMVAAWEPDFTGYIVDYGVHPDQHRGYFSLRDARATLGRLHPGMGREAAIQAGLKTLTETLLAREWSKDDGTIMQIGRGLVDSGYVPEMIYSVIRRSGRMSTIMPSKGIGIGPDGKPFSNYIRKAGEQYGFHWRIPSTRGTRELPTVSIDTNFWKTFVTDRLATGMGDGGSLSLYGAPGQDHQLLSEHLTSEYRIRTQGRNRVVDVWKGRVNVVDNHWFDCLVGCAVGASMLGCSLPGVELVTGKKRQQVGSRRRLSDMQRRIA